MVRIALWTVMNKLSPSRAKGKSSPRSSPVPSSSPSIHVEELGELSDKENQDPSVVENYQPSPPTVEVIDYTSPPTVEVVDYTSPPTVEVVDYTQTSPPTVEVIDNATSVEEQSSPQPSPVPSSSPSTTTTSVEELSPLSDKESQEPPNAENHQPRPPSDELDDDLYNVVVIDSPKRPKRSSFILEGFEDDDLYNVCEPKELSPIPGLGLYDVKKDATPTPVPDSDTTAKKDLTPTQEPKSDTTQQEPTPAQEPESDTTQKDPAPTQEEKSDTANQDPTPTQGSESDTTKKDLTPAQKSKSDNKKQVSEGIPGLVYYQKRPLARDDDDTDSPAKKLKANDDSDRTVIPQNNLGFGSRIPTFNFKGSFFRQLELKERIMIVNHQHLGDRRMDTRLFISSVVPATPGDPDTAAIRRSAPRVFVKLLHPSPGYGVNTTEITAYKRIDRLKNILDSEVKKFSIFVLSLEAYISCYGGPTMTTQIFVMPLLKRDLSAALRERNQYDGPSENVQLWIAQIAAGVHFLHNCGIMHRDLKSENILLDAGDNALVTDFGNSFVQVDWINAKLDYDLLYSRANLGTPGWLAPEVEQGLWYGPASDWWGVGAIMLEAMVHPANFYMALSQFRATRLLYPRSRSGADAKFAFETEQTSVPCAFAREVLWMLLHHDPRDRYRYDQLYSHTYFAVYRDGRVVSIFDILEFETAARLNKAKQESGPTSEDPTEDHHQLPYKCDLWRFDHPGTNAEVWLPSYSKIHQIIDKAYE
ncbi:AGC/AGC1 protein kinase [Coprinopsis cinerea okayama7|uniref:AGC/AGC1 protein kinase n=1 Tax=Coprinopsis cinerea (strain Okayama-7 / 130 / ATCC MYA-4618 / FGSC 9003) TaxID=240176 RepID=A8NZG9_COPC7|nr:AGC/AGC1 protein kinase [Coprinopsis cinerea okayama7\|eukprot:XP_001837677.1 AGC/AGC1 protein kinase [Coprinopsis cinerea okayama7\